MCVLITITNSNYLTEALERIMFSFLGGDGLQHYLPIPGWGATARDCPIIQRMDRTLIVTITIFEVSTFLHAHTHKKNDKHTEPITEMNRRHFSSF